MDQVTEHETRKVGNIHFKIWHFCKLWFIISQERLNKWRWQQNLWLLIQLCIAIAPQVSMFINQINGTNVGFTAFNLFLIDKPSLLMVRLFCFTYALMNWLAKSGLKCNRQYMLWFVCAMFETYSSGSVVSKLRQAFPNDCLYKGYQSTPNC